MAQLPARSFFMSSPTPNAQSNVAAAGSASDRHVGGLAALLMFAAGFTLVFRGWLLSGFDGVFGDTEDGFLALALVEHWRHVFDGTAQWRDPIFFYPAHGTLGYTDAFLLFGLAAAPLRFAGIDAFAAYMIVIAGLAAAGFFGFRHLAMRHFGLPAPAAAIGAFLFAFANIDAVELIHVQTYCAMLLPWLCALVLSAWEDKRRGAWRAAAAGFLYALLFLTAYQTAWFFGFFILLMALLYPAACGVAATRSLVHALAMSRRGMVLAGAAGFAAGIVPFLSLYLPVFLAGHVRGFAEVASNMPKWSDLANVTPANAVWGAILTSLGVAGQPDRPIWEAELAFTPIVTAVFLAGMASFAAERRIAPMHDRSLLLMGLAVVVVWLLQMDYLGVRPWYVIWAAVPGAKAVRYTFRSQLVANLFVALVAARVIAGMTRIRAWAVLLCGVMAVEQINLEWPPRFSRREALAWIDAVPPPPAGCRNFYIAPNAGPPGRSGVQHQDAAALFSEIRGVPTVNGYSSWFPDGWALNDPAAPGYPAAVAAWARRNGIADGICGVDLHAGAWTPGLPPGLPAVSSLLH